jgi:hypothetical protein
MLKKSASIVLASLRGSTLIFSEVGATRGAFPFAKTHCKGERPHTMCGTYLLASSFAAALPAERRVSARRGWAGEKAAFLSILRDVFLLSPTYDTCVVDFVVAARL